MRRVLVVLAAVGFLVLAGTARPASAQLPITQFVLRVGFNSILGDYYQAGLGFRLAGGTLLLGGIYTEELAFEPYVAFIRPWSLPSRWTLSFHASYGDLGGDYRVDRFPEITLSRRTPLSGTPLAFVLDMGLGYYSVHPNNVTGARVSAVPQITASLPLGSAASLTGSLGYRYYAYMEGAANTQWWGSAALTLNPVPALSMTFTYLFEDAWGSSPLLFDTLSDDEYLYGLITLRLSPSVALQHSQKYSFISETISERLYNVLLTMPQGYSLTVTYDDMAQKVTFSLGFSR